MSAKTSYGKSDIVSMREHSSYGVEGQQPFGARAAWLLASCLGLRSNKLQIFHPAFDLLFAILHVQLDHLQ